jgi:hypothetical protein
MVTSSPAVSKGLPSPGEVIEAAEKLKEGKEE